MRRSLHAPREDGQTLILPPLEQVGSLLRGNHAIRQKGITRYDVQGRSLAQLSDAARFQAVKCAVQYSRGYRDVAPPDSAARILLAGHQPQLFHPGVWLKNFVLGRLAAEHGAIAINLLIDNDTAKATSLPVPGGGLAAPNVRFIPYDAPGAAVAYEERKIVEPTVLAGFADEAARQLRPLVPDPLLPEFWPRVVRRAAANGNLGLALAQARHELEGEWGCQTLELPFSQVCETEPFYWFAAHLLAQLPRFWSIHNDSLAEYRRTYRLRSVTHPVPDLTSEDDWLEAPFWLWTRDDPRRRAVFARRANGRVCLTDREDCNVCLPLSAEGDAAAAVQTLSDLPRRGIKLRTRALTTTLWARLVLGDLFLHGIGGAKYDELTDVLIRRFFDLEPPAFMAISGTIYLPVQQPQVNEEDLRRIDQQLRELIFHPEQFLQLKEVRAEEQRQVSDWIVEKSRWIAEPAARERAHARHIALRRINENLQPFVDAWRRSLVAEHGAVAAKLRAAAILGWREYAFCLYPSEKLRTFLLGNARASP